MLAKKARDLDATAESTARSKLFQLLERSIQILFQTQSRILEIAPIDND